MAPEERGHEVRVGFAWYRPDQWSRLLDISIDRDDLENTHAEWEGVATEQFRELLAQGVAVEKIDVDVEELKEWCLDHASLVDASARANFVAMKLRKMHEGE